VDKAKDFAGTIAMALIALVALVGIIVRGDDAPEIMESVLLIAIGAIGGASVPSKARRG
jgi:hypothetical protein